MDIVKFKKNEIIFKEGDYPSCMYDIQTGSVGIYADYGEDTQKALATLYEGDFFGEMGLIDSCPRSATAIALEATSAKKITMDDFSTYMNENPAKVVTIMQHMGDRLRRLSNDYLAACKVIDEYRRCEEAKLPKSPSLMERLRRFSAVRRKSK
ncbi:MAG: cyclic nucleotide-binding domain-containing protein [Sphaerochaetaceae bacterium]|nr:cyclic nucleotide-binding domain-containing protein [Sphaerochaetaceae bacterium]